MQKFVVSPSIAGAHITLGAAKFLAQNYIGSAADMVLIGAWRDNYQYLHPDENLDKLEDDAELRIDTYSGGGKEFRNTLLPYLEELEGDYEKLDQLNDGCKLRIVEVPDGIQCSIMADSDTGCEDVIEHRWCFSAPRDDVYKDIVHVRKLCKTIEDGTTLVKDMTKYNFREVTIAFKGNYGAVRRSNGDFMFLRKNTYFDAIDSNGVARIEIIGDMPTKFNTQKVIHEAEEISAYAELVTLLNAE